jgi:hypothetical protein
MIAIGAAGIAACLAGFAPGDLGAPKANAAPTAELAVNPVPTNEAPPILLTGGACSMLEWPHYEQSCQFDMRPRPAELRTVRIIAVR